MNLEGLKILITSNKVWGEVWYAKHNCALDLSKRNQVVFVDVPPAGRLKLFWLPGREYDRRPLACISFPIPTFSRRAPFGFLSRTPAWFPPPSIPS
jgi:hypothetical protein